MRFRLAAIVTGLMSVLAGVGCAQEARITVRAQDVVGRVSKFLTGACIEDVNHEIYGGLYSQMIFGESFQEAAGARPVRGFTALGGSWQIRGDELWAEGGPGPKLVSDSPAFSSGEAGVEVFFADAQAGNAGLVVKVERAGTGADNFEGYEVSLDAAAQILRLGRHRHNWEPIRDVPCPIPITRWVPLVVRMSGQNLEIRVDGRSRLRYEDRDHPLHSGQAGLRQWRRPARYRNFWIKTNDAPVALPFKAPDSAGSEVSAMWRLVRRGNAEGAAALETSRPFIGAQSQRLTFTRGEGEIGIANQGLNRWGLHFVADRSYEGWLWVRAEKPTEFTVALESTDGGVSYAQQRLMSTGNDWQRLSFSLTPSRTDTAGRFSIKLKRPGSLTLGYVFLEPGPWGRFKELPVRKDVAEALVDQGITVLRYGGSMVNAAQYRWKGMIGPRDRRPPYRGTWYPHSSNGWGIPDFLSFCEAAGFLAIPALNMDETPADLADFMTYVNGTAHSDWGRKRAADGHPEPYRLKLLELGNEERVDEKYFQKFKALAEAIWAADPDVTLVVGDFVYGRPIEDPLSFRGAASGITTLAAHQKILDLAREHQREVWFDVHVGTEGPDALGELRALPSYAEALGKISRGARHKVVVFEFNANNHQQRRALANALAIHAVERLGERVPIATSANGLQPDGQNDNGWNQGLLFLNPSSVWLQPPGYVTRMFSRSYQPLLVRTAVEGTPRGFDLAAKRSEDGRVLVLQVVNSGEQAVPAQVCLDGFTPVKPAAAVEELTAPLDAENTASDPNRVAPRPTEWRHGLTGGCGRFSFAPHSVTVIRLE